MTNPYRVVDAEGEGWLRHPAYENTPEYYDTFPRRDLGELPFAQLDEQRGPLREVVPPPDGDTARLEESLVKAGRKATGTVIVALFHIAKECADRTAERFGHRSSNLLTAGRPGSWESATVDQVAWMLGPYISEHRLDPAALQTCEEVLRGWVLDGPGVVEVAETLAYVLGEVCDELGGWEKMADQWLVRHEGAETVYHWACSRSLKYGPGANY